MKRVAFKLGLACAALLTAAGQVQAGFVELISNGNFETGNFSGWNVQNLAGGSGNWFIDNPGTTTPVSGMATLGSAANGSFYAVTDQGGPGTHVLLQSFVVPVNVVSITLKFDLFANDYDGGPIINPAGLNHNAVPNQHARVDILTAGAAPFSTAAVDVVSNHYLGVDAGADPHPFTSYTFTLTGLTAGATYQLRFGETDNQLFFNVGVDNVSVVAETLDPVPAPAGLVLLASAAPFAGYFGWRRRKQLASA